jgi:hypothetical protein
MRGSSLSTPNTTGPSVNPESLAISPASARPSKYALHDEMRLSRSRRLLIVWNARMSIRAAVSMRHAPPATVVVHRATSRAALTARLFVAQWQRAFGDSSRRGIGSVMTMLR